MMTVQKCNMSVLLLYEPITSNIRQFKQHLPFETTYIIVKYDMSTISMSVASCSINLKQHIENIKPH